MGEALLSGVLQAGWPASSVTAVVRREARAAELRDKYGISVVSAAEAAKDRATLVVAVKPQDMPGALAQISSVVRPAQLLVSIAAGVAPPSLSHHLLAVGSVARIVRKT